MVTAFFEAGPDAWPAVARDLALRLRARGSR
jgi:hypothetical protein